MKILLHNLILLFILIPFTVSAEHDGTIDSRTEEKLIETCEVLLIYYLEKIFEEPESDYYVYMLEQTIDRCLEAYGIESPDYESEDFEIEFFEESFEQHEEHEDE